MITLGTDDNNDLYVDTNGLFVIKSDEQALLQKIKHRLLLFYSEWFLDTTRGVPYFKNILGENINVDIAGSILTNEILKETEVLTADNVEFSLNSLTRNFTYNALLDTIYGEVNINI